MSALPIHAVLPDLLAALRTGSNAVLVAPPGAGETTAVAPALLDEPWCSRQVLLLSPRRLAARAAAFVSDLYDGFRLLNLRNGDLRRKYDGIKYNLERLEQIKYDVQIRKLQASAAVPDA